MSKQIKDDGLGWDPIKKQYFTICYAWQNIVPSELNDENITIKSGITKKNVISAMKSSVLTRGKQFTQHPLWGFDKDRKYLPKGITKTEASLIVNKMDNLFKEELERGNFDIKSQNKTQVGTEFYRGDTNYLLDFIKEVWKLSFENALSLVIDVDTPTTQQKEISYRGDTWKQHKVVETEILNGNTYQLVLAPCGSGKTMMMFSVLNRIDSIKDRKIAIVVAPKIEATIQAALQHQRYAEHTQCEGERRAVIVCSYNSNNSELQKYGVDVVSASSSELKDLLKISFTQSQKYTFYVNMKSAGTFWDVYSEVKTEVGFTENAVNILDEVHRYVGHISKFNTQCVVKAKEHCDIQIGYSANLSERGVVSDTENKLYHDDTNWFGKVTYKITPHEAITQKLNSEVEFHLVEVYSDELDKEIQKNNEIEVSGIKKSTESVRGMILKAIPAIKTASDMDISHIYIPTSRKANVTAILNFIKEEQKNGNISDDYILFNGIKDSKNDGKAEFDKFSKVERGIICSTRWSIESLDYPIIKAVIPINNYSSKNDVDQTYGRGMRICGDKVAHIFIPVHPNEKDNLLLEVANDKLLNQITTVSQTKDTQDIDLNKIMTSLTGSSQNAKIRVSHHKNPALPPNMRVAMDEVYSLIGTTSYGEIKDKWKIYSYTDDEVIEDALKFKTPHQWRSSSKESESKYFHAWHRKDKDDLLELATAHMDKRTEIDSNQKVEEFKKISNEFEGIPNAYSLFLKKYGKFATWLKYNSSKAPNPVMYGGEPLSGTHLPFSKGKFGYLKKEDILLAKSKSKNLTEWAKLLNMPYQTLKQLCEKFDISVNEMILPIDVRAKVNGSINKMIIDVWKYSKDSKNGRGEYIGRFDGLNDTQRKLNVTGIGQYFKHNMKQMGGYVFEKVMKQRKGNLDLYNSNKFRILV